MKKINDTIVHEDCQFYDNKTAPREYGAYCTKHKKLIDNYKSKSTIDCGDCDELINDEVETKDLKVLNRDTGEYTTYKDVY